MSGRKVGLPEKPFLWTLDQVCTFLEVDERALKASYLYFEGRSTGIQSPNLMRTRNIAPEPSGKAEWRVSDKELKRWLRRKGFREYVS